MIWCRSTAIASLGSLVPLLDAWRKFLLLMLREEHAPGHESTSSPSLQRPQKRAPEGSQKALWMDRS